MFKPARPNSALRAIAAGTALCALGACVSERATTLTGESLFAVSPAAFTCQGGTDLALEIVQSSDGNATGIRCADGSDCTTANAFRNQTIEWTLASGNTSQRFYVIFDDDKSPSHKNGNKGANITASAAGRLCTKVHTNARMGEYSYSVYVKHCATRDASCRPEVLDPIIYVR